MVVTPKLRSTFEVRGPAFLSFGRLWRVRACGVCSLRIDWDGTYVCYAPPHVYARVAVDGHTQIHRSTMDDPPAVAAVLSWMLGGVGRSANHHSLGRSVI